MKYFLGKNWIANKNFQLQKIMYNRKKIRMQFLFKLEIAYYDDYISKAKLKKLILDFQI